MESKVIRYYWYVCLAIFDKDKNVIKFGRDNFGIKLYTIILIINLR